MKKFALVYLPLNLAEPYSYAIPPSMNIKQGDIVLVPLRNKEVYGIVFDFVDHLNFDEAKVKNILDKDENMPSISFELMDFLKKLSKYYVESFGNVLKLAINVAGFNLNQYDEILQLNPNFDKQIKFSEQRKKIIEYLSIQNSISKDVLIKQGNSIAVINGLIKEGLLLKHKEISYSNFQEALEYQNIPLSTEQINVMKDLMGIYEKNKNNFLPIVLQGVPGAGKTEIYFELASKVLQENKQVLIMLPEIALSTQIVERFEKRFKVKPYVWHSSISNKTKKDTWICADNGNLKLIIGTRSSLFLPFKNLGLIVVDEEHDSSYKQEEGVIYNARDMAILRAYIHKIPIMLCSATPSLETLYNVKQGKYHLLKLSSRFNKYQMPDINIIDMKQESLGKNNLISATLLSKIQTNLEQNLQSLLFVNKRGYANTMLCKSCGEKIICINCAIAMVEHRSKNSLLCHYCGYMLPKPIICKSCEAENSLLSLGFGVEKVYEEVIAKLPNAKVVILSSDTMNTHNKAIKLIKQINDLEYDIIIGTQIISKGYHFPKLTCVGILDADFMYALDLKSCEKAWQLLYQVAGRSGRGDNIGEVFMQSYNPSSVFVESLIEKNYENFIENETKIRETLGFPPFGKLAGIIVSSEDIKALNDFCKILEDKKPYGEDYEILGSMVAPIAFLRKYHRKRFLVKTKLNVNIQKLISHWLNIKIPSNIKLQIDVDPISFY